MTSKVIEGHIWPLFDVQKLTFSMYNIFFFQYIILSKIYMNNDIVMANFVLVLTVSLILRNKTSLPTYFKWKYYSQKFHESNGNVYLMKCLMNQLQSCLYELMNQFVLMGIPVNQLQSCLYKLMNQFVLMGIPSEPAVELFV